MKGNNGLPCSGTKNTVRGNIWNRIVYICNSIKLFLHLAHFASARADRERFARIGGRNAGDLLGGIDIDGLAIVVAQDLDGGIALVSEGF